MVCRGGVGVVASEGDRPMAGDTRGREALRAGLLEAGWESPHRPDRALPGKFGGVAVWTIEDHLRGKSEHVRALFEAFERVIAECGSYRTTVTKTAVSFKGPVRGFAGATPRSSSLAGFLDLTEEVYESPFTRVSPYTSRLWVHRFVIQTAEQFSDQFARRVQEAYLVGQGHHRL
jgi:hypothetical protein